MITGAVTMKRLLFIAGALLSANVAAAQTIGTSKIYLIINGGYQLTANDFVDGAVRRENAEDGRVDSSYNVKAGPSLAAEVSSGVASVSVSESVDSLFRLQPQ
jgi:hypothetical protein